MSTKSKIFNKIFQFFGYLSIVGSVHHCLKANILYSQLSRSLEMHVQGTLKINNSIKQCLILEKNFYFCEFLFLSLDLIKKPLHRLCIEEASAQTSRNNSVLAKLLWHLFRSQSPYLEKLFFVYFGQYSLFKLHCSCADFVVLKILGT